LILAHANASNRQLPRIVVLEFAGHGKSQRKPGGDYQLATHVRDCYEVVTNCLGWSRFSVLGHSLGSSVAAMLAAVIPERVRRLIMLEGLGPFSREEKAVVRSLRARIIASKPIAGLYPSAEAAIKRRSQANVVGTLDLEAARVLGSRGLAKSKEDSTQFSWTYDPMVKLPSISSLSETQVQQFLLEIECPVLLLYTQDGILNAFGPRGFGAKVIANSWLGYLLQLAYFLLLMLNTFVSILFPSLLEGTVNGLAKGAAYAHRVRILKQKPRSSFVALPDGGHHPQLTRPGSCALKIIDFIEQTGGW